MTSKYKIRCKNDAFYPEICFCLKRAGISFAQKDKTRPVVCRTEKDEAIREAFSECLLKEEDYSILKKVGESWIAIPHEVQEVKERNLPILRKSCCHINNQNYKVKGSCIEFPVMINGKSKRISVSVKLTERQKSLFSDAKFGTMRIVVKNHMLVAQIVYEVIEPEFKTDGNVMGIDLGIKCPAVSYCSDGSVKFYGNGRKNKYMRRHYAYLRKKLQIARKMKAVKRINNKEQRIMRDIDHKISHDIVKTAVEHNVKVIKLEQLQNIRSATRTSRKNNHSLHTWSFYRLAQFIEYKAKLAGISVEYVNTTYTSQTCPICGNVHHANDRHYTCKCGFHIHRDLLGAMNIENSTEFVGNRQTA